MEFVLPLAVPGLLRALWWSRSPRLDTSRDGLRLGVCGWLICFDVSAARRGGLIFTPSGDVDERCWLRQIWLGVRVWAVLACGNHLCRYLLGRVSSANHRFSGSAHTT
ncbi:hypothetical protein AKJ16_DCAP06547 [Drosera capensis]